MTQQQPRKRPGRPRDPAKDTELLDAALAEFGEHGLHGMTLDSLAARAGISKMTLYRRWNSKNALAADVLAALADQNPPPDTGSLEGDLTALLNAAITAPDATRQAAVFLRTMGEIATDPELLAAYRVHLLEPRLTQIRTLLARAQTRNELRTDVSLEALAGLIAGPLTIYYLALLSQLQIDWPEDLARQWARTLCTGIR